MVKRKKKKAVKKVTKKEKIKDQEIIKDTKQESNDTENTMGHDQDEKTEIDDKKEEESFTPPKPVERLIMHPKTNVVRSPDSSLDQNWGWALEFPSEETLSPIWENLKEFLEKNDHPLYGKLKWLSMDPRGYFSPRLRHFIVFTGWGMQIESLPNWFSKNFGEIKKPTKEIEASEELADENWQGYITKESIDLMGPKFIKLKSAPRKKRKLDIEAKNPVPSSIPRYWAQYPLFKARDYLIPFVTFEKHNEGITKVESYLEEYIIEQLEWIKAGKNKKYVVLPEQFTSDPDKDRGINIPEEYTPELDLSNMGGMFPGMGGMGGLPGMDSLGDIDDLDLSETESDNHNELDDDSSNENGTSHPDVVDAEIIDENSNT